MLATTRTGWRVLSHSYRRPLCTSGEAVSKGCLLPPPTAYNSLTGTIERLDSRDGSLKWYSCGPTVYDAAHIGHARTYVSLDILRRLLVRLWGYDVTYVMGVTDVDDKIIQRAQERGNPDCMSFAREWEEQFFLDMETLGVLRPTAVVRVTEHIDEIVEYINRILGNGFAYRRDSGVYFDVARMGSRYGRLSGHSVHSVTGEGALLASDQGDKRRPEDFALWKAAKAGEPSWPSPFGPGRPGWHIECSAMSHAIFGDSLDLHSGGIDLKFPHHENEIAQCEAFSCCSPTSLHSSEKSSDWCRHWLHTGHLHIDGRKMSKSLKNFITVKEMLAEGVHAEDFRFFCLMHRYRAPTTYTASRLSEASLMRSSLRRALRVAADAVEHRSNRTSQRRWGAREHELLRYQIRARKRVLEALANDFDTPRALELLREAASVCTTYVEESVDCLIPEPLQATTSFIVDMLDLFGLGETAALEKKGGHIADPSSTGAVCSTSELVDCIANFRHQIRCAALASKKGGGDDLADSLLSSCDEMRSRSLPALGISLEDVAHDPRGYRWLHLDERIAQPGPTLSDADGARSLKKRREEEERIFLGTPADELFRDSDLYSQWDPSGFPTHDVDGAELSKSRRKKLLKVRDKHARLTQNKI